MDQGLARLQAGQGSGGALLRDTRQYEQALAQVADLRRSIHDLRGSGNDDRRTRLRRLDAAGGRHHRQVDQFNASPMLTTSAVYDNLQGMAKELQTTTKDFRENPKKYLRVKVF